MDKKLSDIQIQNFINSGFIKIENAFPRQISEEGRSLLWTDMGCDPNNPDTWTKPVIRLGEYGQEPFRRAVNMPLLLTAFDQLAGKGKWIPRNSLGTFPVRFPSSEEPRDTGWHVDASFAGDDPHDYFTWRINIKSKGRALLMLFLFSDVGEHDAPTRIITGSHFDVAKLLQPAGEEGLSSMELAEKIHTISNKLEITATGEAGTVYLCHPFLVHAAQPHHGKNPRFLAQPPLIANGDFDVFRESEDFSPVEIAIRKGIGLDR